MRTISLLLLASLFQSQPPPRAQAAQSWRDHRFGLFVHWGVASGRALAESHSHARRSPLNPKGPVPADVYDEYYKEFNPSHYDPDSLLKLAHDAGMRYAVFVAKHHDGFSMYRSPANPYSVMATPYGKDIAGEFAAAARRQGLALGWQISPKDWKHPDFNTADQDRYNAYYESIIRELATQYGPLTTMWFDGTEPLKSTDWLGAPDRIREYLHRVQPNIMLSNHSGAPEDFVSFESMVGPFDRRQPWESTEAINPSGWVFNQPMPTYPLRKLLRNLVYTIGRDGNYLLDVGPMPDGQLYPPDADRLREFAAFMKHNAEAVHGTRGGPYRDGDWGAATCKGNSIYLFISDRVANELHLIPIKAKIKSARRLDGGAMTFRVNSSGLHLQIPGREQPAARPLFLCVRLELDQPALSLPILEAQPNLAATAKFNLTDPKLAHLFDHDGNTAWDPALESLTSALEMDFGQQESIGAISFSQRSQRASWHQYFRYSVQVRNTPAEPWRKVFDAHTCLGGIPILELPPTSARYLRLEWIRPRKDVPLDLAELRITRALPQAP